MKTFEQVMELTQIVSGNAAFEDPECRAYYDCLCSLPDGATVVEIGLQFGRSSSIVLQLQADKKFKYIGIDPFIEPPEAQQKWIEMAHSTGADYLMIVATTGSLVVDFDHLPPEVDLCLVDGDHTEAGVSVDCAVMIPRIKRGGYILFHDYGRDSLPDVYPTAQRFLASHPEFEELPTVGTLGIWRRK